jgi:hypothetical protein
MAPSGIRPAARLRLALILAVAAGLLVAACSGSTGSPAPTSGAAAATPAPTGAPSPTATVAASAAAPTPGPATQHLSVVGPAGSSGALSNAQVRCNLPSPGGLQISVLAQPVDPNLSVYVFVQSGSITVRYDSGSGSTYVERDFSGTGVTGFDAAKGAQIDSPLTEVPNSDAHGNLGQLTSISGSVDCGNQMPGSSTLTLGGTTSKGTLSGGLNPVNVECLANTSGSSVSILGLVEVGSTPTLAVVYVSPGTLSVSLSGDGFFRNTSTAVATLTSAGAHVDADLLEQNPAKGAKAATIHVAGDAVCGTSIGS